LSPLIFLELLCGRKSFDVMSKLTRLGKNMECPTCKEHMRYWLDEDGKTDYYKCPSCGFKKDIPVVAMSDEDLEWWLKLGETGNKGK